MEKKWYKSKIEFNIYTPTKVEHVNVGDLVYIDYDGVIHLYKEKFNA